MHLLRGLDRPVLPAFQKIADFLVNFDLRRALAAEVPDLELIRTLLQEAQDYDVSLDALGVAFGVSRTVARLLELVAADPKEVTALTAANGLLETAAALPFPVDLWKAQNTYYGLRETALADRRTRAATGD